MPEIDLSRLSPTERDALGRLFMEGDARKASKFFRLFPDEGPLRRELYPRHLDFFTLGATKPERLFMAANRIGKTESGAYEVTCHTTGRYPPWWQGRRFATAGEWWACGTTGETTRDIIQTKLLGPWQEGAGGEQGMIPEHLIQHRARKTHGLQGALEAVWVEHITGAASEIRFKTYEQGRKSFEGTSKHGIWFDEEPPMDVYTEGLYRTATTDGIVFTTFTPLQGMSEVVKSFLQPENDTAKLVKAMVNAGWDHVPHLSGDVKARLIATTPPYLIEARTQGLPTLGAGAIYALPESELKVADFAVPKHWPRCWGLDAGGGAKPTAVTWLALDRENGIVYVYAVYKRTSPEIAVHVAAVKARGDWIEGVGDAAALITTQDDAERLIDTYRRCGLNIHLPDKGVESGLQAVWELMSAGRFKVFASCEPWWQEFRLYHRDERGRIVKSDDHLLDATRYAVVSGLKRAKTQPGPKREMRMRPGRGGDQAWMGR